MVVEMLSRLGVWSSLPKIGAPTRKYHAGSWSTPVAVGLDSIGCRLSESKTLGTQLQADDYTEGGRLFVQWCSVVVIC